MPHLKFFPIFKQKSLGSNPNLLMPIYITLSGEDKTPLKEKQK
jgi:hypothetical protein